MFRNIMGMNRKDAEGFLWFNHGELLEKTQNREDNTSHWMQEICDVEAFLGVQ